MHRDVPYYTSPPASVSLSLPLRDLQESLRHTGHLLDRPLHPARDCELLVPKGAASVGDSRQAELLVIFLFQPVCIQTFRHFPHNVYRVIKPSALK